MITYVNDKITQQYIFTLIRNFKIWQRAAKHNLASACGSRTVGLTSVTYVLYSVDDYR